MRFVVILGLLEGLPLPFLAAVALPIYILLLPFLMLLLFVPGFPADDACFRRSLVDSSKNIPLKKTIMSRTEDFPILGQCGVRQSRHENIMANVFVALCAEQFSTRAD